MNRFFALTLAALLFHCATLAIGAESNVNASMLAERLYEQAELAMEKAKSPSSTRFSINLYAEAAKSGSRLANHQMGMIYLSGLRVPKDEQKAIKHLILAAEQNVLQSQIELGKFYERSTATPAAVCLAYGWWARAVANGEIDALDSLNRVHRKCVEALAK